MKTYSLVATSDPEIEKLVDREGDWTHYFHKPSGQYLRSVNFVLDSGFAKGYGFYQFLKNTTPEEAERKLKTAGDRGDAVHQVIKLTLGSGGGVARFQDMTVLAENNVDKRPLTDKEWDCVLAFATFWNRHEPELLACEMVAYNLTQGYAGTTDAIVRMTKTCGVKACPCAELVGKVGLLDWKTSGGIYESYGPQVSAYANAENFPVINYTGIVRIGTNHKTTGGYQFEAYDTQETRQHFKEFLAAKTVQDATYKPFDPEKDIAEIPDEFLIKIVEAADRIVISAEKFRSLNKKVSTAEVKQAPAEAENNAKTTGTSESATNNSEAQTGNEAPKGRGKKQRSAHSEASRGTKNGSRKGLHKQKGNKAVAVRS